MTKHPNFVTHFSVISLNKYVKEHVQMYKQKDFL